MTTVKELLIAARALIADEANWTTEQLAVDRDGEHVAPNDNRACRMCGLGAVAKAHGVSSNENTITSYEAAEALDEISLELFEDAYGQSDFHRRPMAFVNDILGHAAVLRVYDATIEKA